MPEYGSVTALRREQDAFAAKAEAEAMAYARNGTASTTMSVSSASGHAREAMDRLRTLVCGLREARVRLQDVLNPEPRPVPGTNGLRDAPPSGGLASIGPDLGRLCDELESEVKQLHTIA